MGIQRNLTKWEVEFPSGFGNWSRRVGGVMIDWITVKIPFDWVAPINSGLVEWIDPQGGLDRKTTRDFKLVGSNESSIQVQSSVDRSGQKILLIHGNPSKFLQGHNLFGTNDIRALCLVLFCEISSRLGHQFSQSEYNAWNTGQYWFSRVDLNYMYACGSRSRVRELLRTIKYTQPVHYQGDELNGLTLYLKPPARRRSKPAAKRQAAAWQVKMYGKADEIWLNEVPTNVDEWNSSKNRDWGGALPFDLPYRDELCAWADDKLRLEVQLNRKILHPRRLNHASNWDVGVVESLLDEFLLKIKMPEVCSIDAATIDSLPWQLRLTYKGWLHGDDLRAVLPRSTFSTYRAKLNGILGIDISIMNFAADPNIIRSVIAWNMLPAPIPDWAFRTSLLVSIEAAEVDFAARDYFFKGII